jgi:hypothetical protein
MNDTCPICGKECGTVVGDFPRSYFCEGHTQRQSFPLVHEQQYPIIYANVGSKNEERIIELLEKILAELKNIK